MSKSSIICSSCGQDNDPAATFCIECGVSMKAPVSDKSVDLEESKQLPDKSNQSKTKTSPSQPKYPCQMMMMRGMNPMFIMMPIMFIIMVGVLIYITFIQ